MAGSSASALLLALLPPTQLTKRRLLPKPWLLPPKPMLKLAHLALSAHPTTPLKPLPKLLLPKPTPPMPTPLLLPTRMLLLLPVMQPATLLRAAKGKRAAMETLVTAEMVAMAVTAEAMEVATVAEVMGVEATEEAVTADMRAAA